ncbi:hypothetical protein FRB99_007027, partial [Tulasnella sp. 403]
MPVQIAEAPYPLIDSDPHASRVVRYMRPSDYAVMAGGTAAAPAMLWAVVRFWGWAENSREQKRDFEELSKRAKDGKPLYGESDLDAHLQGVAHRNSAFSQLKF